MFFYRYLRPIDPVRPVRISRARARPRSYWPCTNPSGTHSKMPLSPNLTELPAHLSHHSFALSLSAHSVGSPSHRILA